MGWNVRISSTFQPAGTVPIFLPLPSASSFARHQALRGFFSPVFLGGVFSRFIHSTSSLASYTRSLHSPYSFCRWDNDVFILHTTRCPEPF